MAFNSRQTGFTLTEALIVVAIIAIVATMGLPLLARLAPVQRLKSEAENMAAFMQEARVKAASTQRPIRVGLRCPDRETSEEPCRLKMQTAEYTDQGEIHDWMPNNPDHYAHQLARQVFAIPAKTGDDKGDDSGGLTPLGWVWIIFMPNGKTLSSPQPFELHFHADDLGGKNGRTWALEVNENSGRSTLTLIKK